MLIRSINRKTGDERWRMVKASAVDGDPRLAVNVIEDVTEVKRAELGQRFLAEASAVLASSLDYEQTLAKVADLVVPDLADWCSVALPHGDWLRAVAVAHVDPAKREFAAEYQRRFPIAVDAPIGAAQVLRDGSSQLIGPIEPELLASAIEDPEQHEALGGLGLRWVMVVPMVAGPRVIGVINFVSSESGRRFTQSDLELAEELGRRAGAAVEKPASTRSAPTSPPRCSAACSPTSCRASPACGSPRSTGRRARRTWSAVTSTTPSRRRADGCCSSATSPAAARRRPR